MTIWKLTRSFTSRESVFLPQEDGFPAEISLPMRLRIVLRRLGQLVTQHFFKGLKVLSG